MVKFMMKICERDYFFPAYLFFLKPWILLTINGLNATYIIWREGKFTGADVGIIGEHESTLIIRMGETQGMAKLMSSNKEQVEPL